MVVQYKVEIATAMNSAIGSQLWVINNGTSAVNLNGMTLRYYLTNEVTAQLMNNINWGNRGPLGGPNTNLNTGEVTLAVMPLSPPVPSADAYVEFHFNLSNPMLNAGHRVQFSWTVQNFASQKFNQPGDYSFNANGAQMDWPNVVLFDGPTVAWGVEP